MQPEPPQTTLYSVAPQAWVGHVDHFREVLLTGCLQGGLGVVLPKHPGHGAVKRHSAQAQGQHGIEGRQEHVPNSVS